MRMFGLCAPRQSAADMWREDLPFFFAPKATSDNAGGISQLQRNAELVLKKIGNKNRDYMIAFDDTV